MSETADLLDGLARVIHAAGIAQYRPDGPFQAGDVPVTFKSMPANPDRAVTLSSYGASDHPTIPLGERRVQVRVRGLAGDALDADALADAIFGAFHGLTHQQYGSVHVIQMLRVSTIPLGSDDLQRDERSDNYALDVNPVGSANRPD